MAKKKYFVSPYGRGQGKRFNRRKIRKTDKLEQFKTGMVGEIIHDGVPAIIPLKTTHQVDKANELWNKVTEKQLNDPKKPWHKPTSGKTLIADTIVKSLGSLCRKINNGQYESLCKRHLK